MTLRLTNEFRKGLSKLSSESMERTKARLKLLEENPTYPYHPHLKIKRMQGGGKYYNIYEGHISDNCVFTFHKEYNETTGEQIIVLRKIGTHKIYKNP